MFLCCSLSPVRAQTSVFTYQGRLTDGVSAANGTYEMQFTLHSAVSGPGSQIGSAVTNNSVIVANGVFVELYRSDSSGYSANVAQLIASISTTTSGGIIWTLSAGLINSSFATVDNSNYRYFIRYSGEQSTQNLRFSAARITYSVTRVN